MYFNLDIIPQMNMLWYNTGIWGDIRCLLWDHWLTPSHHVTWTNADLSPIKSCGIHLRSISKQCSVIKISDVKIISSNMTSTSSRGQSVKSIMEYGFVKRNVILFAGPLFKIKIFCLTNIGSPIVEIKTILWTSVKSIMEHGFVKRNVILFTGPLFKIKIFCLTNIGSPIVEIKTILWTSYIHNEISYTGKTTTLCWIMAPSFTDK